MNIFKQVWKFCVDNDKRSKGTADNPHNAAYI